MPSNPLSSMWASSSNIVTLRPPTCGGQSRAGLLQLKLLLGLCREVAKELDEAKLQLKLAADETQHHRVECSKLEDILRQYRANFAVTDVDKVS